MGVVASGEGAATRSVPTKAPRPAQQPPRGEKKEQPAEVAGGGLRRGGAAGAVTDFLAVVGEVVVVDLPVAVVVFAVADLVRSGVDRRVAIIAISATTDENPINVPTVTVATAAFGVGVSVAIGVEVFVADAIAVVVFTITGFCPARVGFWVAVVAVPIAFAVAIGVDAVDSDTTLIFDVGVFLAVTVAVAVAVEVLACFADAVAVAIDQADATVTAFIVRPRGRGGQSPQEEKATNCPDEGRREQVAEFHRYLLSAAPLERTRSKHGCLLYRPRASPRKGPSLIGTWA